MVSLKQDTLWEASSATRCVGTRCVFPAPRAGVTNHQSIFTSTTHTSTTKHPGPLVQRSAGDYKVDFSTQALGLAHARTRAAWLLLAAPRRRGESRVGGVRWLSAADVAVDSNTCVDSFAFRGDVRRRLLLLVSVSLRIRE